MSRTVTYSFPAQTQVEICATQTTTSASQSLLINGGLSNYTLLNSPFSGYIAQANFPGIQRTVQIYSTGNISTSTFTITGFDVQGYSYTTTLAGPTGTGTPVHTTQEFSKITAISVNTAATSPFTVGAGASGSTNAYVTNTFVSPCVVAIGLTQSATTTVVTFQQTYDSLFTSTAPTWLTATDATTLAVATVVTYTNVAQGYRAIFLPSAVTGATSSITVQISQAGI